MTLIKLGYDPKNKSKWKELPNDFVDEEYNKKLVVHFHEGLWKLIKVIIKMKQKGWDSILLIDGRRRSGKSTLAMQIAYLLDPNLTIDNYVSGIEEAPDKISKIKNESALIFDEGSLVAGSRDTMQTQSKQLHKVIDVIGQKRLTIIFCMPNFTNISRQIVVDHSMFLIRTGVKKKTLERGLFKVYKNKRMKQLYEMAKKNPKYQRKISHSFNGKFKDFHLPFEEEYFKLKLSSMNEALNPNRKKNKILTESDYKTQFIVKFKELCPDVTDETIWKGFGISKAEYYRRRRLYKKNTLGNSAV